MEKFIKTHQMKILVTGSGGFIGYHLSEKLKKGGVDVVGIDNGFHLCGAKTKYLQADVRNARFMDELIGKVDMVYHLAAQIHVDYSIKYPEETYDINLIGTLNILNSCLKYKKKLIFASTSEVYGASLTEFIEEDHPLNPHSPYAASKVAADRLCYAYYKTYGINVSILRNFNTFGPFQNDDSYGSVIAKFTKRAFKNEPLEIYGSGEQERDYMYIDDALKGYDICAKNNLHGKSINIGSGLTIKIKDVAKIIKKITGSRSEIIHVNPRPGEVERLCAGTNSAKKMGFAPETNFERDIEKYIKWYKNFYNI